MSSGSSTHIPVEVAAGTTATDCGTKCHVCIANPNHGNTFSATVQQPQQQQQGQNIATSPPMLKTCLLCCNDYCALHESEQEGVCDSNHVSMWKKKMAVPEAEQNQHQGMGGNRRSVERKVRVFRSLEQRPERA